MSKKGNAATPVNDPRIGAAAEASQKISGEEWDWFKNTYMPEQAKNQAQVEDTSNNVLSQYMNTLIPAQQQALDTTTKTADTASASALDQMQKTGATGDQIYQTWGQDYAPLYSQIAQTAAAKGGQADQDYQAMMARGDVAQSFANAQGQNERYMAQYGQSPISGTSQALQRTSGLNQAAQEAAAQTAARQAASNLGWTYQTQAAQIGSGLLSAGQSAYGASQAAGSSAVQDQTAKTQASTALGQSYTGALNAAGAPVNTLATAASPISAGGTSAGGVSNASTSGLTAQQATNAQAAAGAASGQGSMIGSLVGAAGTVAGAYFGGPMGAAAGGAAAKALTGGP